MAQPILRFMVCSDLHFKDEKDCIERKRFEEGLRLLYAYADSQEYKNVDAVYIVGDFANSGSRPQMESVKEALDEGLRPGTKVNLCMASHEYFGDGGEDGARLRFREIFDQEDNTHRVINGFHFISVTSTRGCRYDKPQQDYTERELKAAHADTPKMPVFFFQHPHIMDTVCGSVNWGNDDMNPILVNYPQIIDFSGHSHAPVNDPRSIHQEHFTSVGTGTFSYFELDEFDKIYGTLPPDKGLAAQMIIVEAYENGAVDIKPYDVLTKRFFDGISWHVESPWNPQTFEYTREKRMKAGYAPHFETDDLELSQDENGLKISFTQAKCDEERVNDYIINIYDEDGAIERHFTLWSHYYLNDMPEKMEYTIAALPEGKYTAEVTARGFWYNYSKDKLTKEFTV